MTTLEPRPDEIACPSRPVSGPTRELLDGVPVALGGPRGLPVTRTLPHRRRRMVGAWCFLDAYGPVSLADHEGEAGPGMQVPPHPHTGLQTVSWLVEGEILHHDSVGSTQLVRPGQLNLMTAGRGISHSEQTPGGHGPRLHGVQLWVALPDSARFVAPSFEHRADLPRLTLPGRTGSAEVVVLVGEVAGRASAAVVHSPLMAAEVVLGAGADVDVPLAASFEHAVLVMSGEVDVLDGQGPEAEETLRPGPLLYLGGGRDAVRLRAREGAAVLLIGGEPLGEDLVMWWNFVGRSHDEIVRFREDWQAGRGFGEVVGHPGPPLPAPPMPTARLRPRPAVPPQA